MNKPYDWQRQEDFPLDVTTDESSITLLDKMRRFGAIKLLTTMAVSASLIGSGETANADTIPAPKGGPSGQVGLSDGFKTTEWAYANAYTQVRNWPTANSKKHFPLRILAPDGDPEVYIVRSTWRDSNGVDWARIRIPDGVRSKEGWVTRNSLGNFGVSHDEIRINREKYILTMYKDGKPVIHAPVGIGRPSLPTPAGHFWVRSRLHNDESGSFKLFGNTIPNSVYGPEIIMTSVNASGTTDWPGGGTMGIHGTNEPWLVPGRPSHGCVRVTNDNIRRIYPLASTGTPIDIK
ncbi:MAG TPA: L,D-transpeptidase [Candidatus Saccharimonadales bacterium]|nr:L,D-transpeptidase [Candidatus Saccharimonadales bacterium]